MRVDATRLDLPPSYGSPGTVLEWAEVERRLTEARYLWLVTTRADGRAHSVPVDGLWVDGSIWFGGDPATVHVRNLRRDPRAVVHTESAWSPVIVEGDARWHRPGGDEAERLAAAAGTKYGYGDDPAAYRGGTWRLEPRVVKAWTVLYEDATRFTVHPT